MNAVTKEKLARLKCAAYLMLLCINLKRCFLFSIATKYVSDSIAKFAHILVNFM